MLRLIFGGSLLCLGMAQLAGAYPLKYYSPEVACGEASASLIARDGCSPLPLALLAEPEEPVPDALPAEAPEDPVYPVEPAAAAPVAAPPVPEPERTPSRGGFVTVDWRAWQLQKWLDSISRPRPPVPAPAAPAPDGSAGDAAAPGGGLPTAPPAREDTLPGDDTGGIITGVLDPAFPDIPGDAGLAGRQPGNIDGDDGVLPAGDPAAGAPTAPVAVIDAGEPPATAAIPLPPSSLLLAAGLLVLMRRRQRGAD